MCLCSVSLNQVAVGLPLIVAFPGHTRFFVQNSRTSKRLAYHFQGIQRGTVKTFYNVTRYNRIFNIQHKIAGNGSVSIEIPSL